MDKLLERFLNYVSLDTQSKAGVRQVPSTEGQWKLLHLLKEQLEEMGLINVTLSEKGTLMATLPANVDVYKRQVERQRRDTTNHFYPCDENDWSARRYQQ